MLELPIISISPQLPLLYPFPLRTNFFEKKKKEKPLPSPHFFQLFTPNFLRSLFPVRARQLGERARGRGGGRATAPTIGRILLGTAGRPSAARPLREPSERRGDEVLRQDPGRERGTAPRPDLRLRAPPKTANFPSRPPTGREPRSAPIETAKTRDRARRRPSPVPVRQSVRGASVVRLPGGRR